MPDNTTIDIGNHTYSIGKMVAMKQFHIVRRLTPVIVLLVPIMMDMRNAAPADKVTDSKNATTAGEQQEQEPDAQASLSGLLAVKMENLVALANALGDLPDSNLDYIIKNCLAHVKRRQAGGTGWTVVWNPSAELPMFMDMELPTMLRLVAMVVWENLQGFISAANALGLVNVAKN